MVSLRVILAYLRKTQNIISAPRARLVASMRPAPEPLLPPPDDDLGDPRVAKIISEIPQRRTRQHAYA